MSLRLDSSLPSSVLFASASFGRIEDQSLAARNEQLQTTRMTTSKMKTSMSSSSQARKAVSSQHSKTDLEGFWGGPILVDSASSEVFNDLES